MNDATMNHQTTTQPPTNPFTLNSQGKVTLRDDAPQWVRDWVYAAHDDELPDDWRYDKCETIYLVFGDASNADVDPTELVEGCVDIYMSDLLSWVAGGNVTSRTTLIDEVLEQAHENHELVTIDTVIQRAQFAALLEMSEMFVAARDAALGIDDDDDDDTDTNE